MHVAVGFDGALHDAVALDAVAGLNVTRGDPAALGDLDPTTGLQVNNGDVRLDDDVFDLDCLVATGAGRAHRAHGNGEPVAAQVAAYVASRPSFAHHSGGRGPAAVAI